MKTFITFGQGHAHRHGNVTLDCNIVAVIERPTEKEARDRAFELWGDKWAFSYPEHRFGPEQQKFFPRGTIEVE